MKIKSLIIPLTVFVLIICITGCKKDISTIESGKEITLRLEPKQGNPRNSEGDFIQLKDGRILFIYTHFTDGSGDNAKAFLAGRYSDDKGRSWTSKDVKILANEGGMNIMSVSLLRLQNGEIALFYLRKNSETDCIPYIRFSSDEAKTWSDPVRCIAKTAYHVVNNDRLIQLPDGRIIFPTTLHAAPRWANGTAMCFYSDDSGKTWTRSKDVPNPNNIVLQEPGVVELKDGKLMMFLRTDTGKQYFSFSNDQGKTWTPVEPGNIKSPLSPASIERIPSTADLLLLWNNNYKKVRDGGKRTPFNLAISKDDGKTWEKIKTVESDPDGWYCYTAIEFVDDHVLLGHCAGDTKTNSGLSTTQITRLSMDWIYKDATNPPFIANEKGGLITLSCKDKNAKIRYTLYGENLAADTGIIYHKPIEVMGPTVIRMQAFAKDKTPSQIVVKSVGTHIFQPAQKLKTTPLRGLNYKYFEGNFQQVARIEKGKEIHTGVVKQFSINKSSKDMNFAFLFEGLIYISKEGLYTFYLNSNDGSVLYINDQKIVDNDGSHGAYEMSGSTSLRKGFHKIRVKYFQAGGGKLLKVYWKNKDFQKEAIPTEVLFH